MDDKYKDQEPTNLSIKSYQSEDPQDEILSVAESNVNDLTLDGSKQIV